MFCVVCVLMVCWEMEDVMLCVGNDDDVMVVVACVENDDVCRFGGGVLVFVMFGMFVMKDSVLIMFVRECLCVYDVEGGG